MLFALFTSSWCAYVLVLSVLHLHQLAAAAPLPTPISAPKLSSGRTSTKPRKGGAVLPLSSAHRHVRRQMQQGQILGGSIGLGDSADLFYTVAMTLGNSTTAVHLDSGSSDLWVMSDQCQTKECIRAIRSGTQPYDLSQNFKPSGRSVNLQYGDSVSGSHATGPVGRDSVTLASLTLPDQTLAAIDDTNNFAISNGGAGILGLGFPSQSFVQAAAINAEFNNPPGTDTFVAQTAKYGPMVPRLILADMIDDPLFTVTLQRNTIDVSGEGQITIGQLPDDVDETSIHWVPVRLYDPAEGGLSPPSFAPNEKYPLRWEVEIDGVFLDGKRLPQSTQPLAGLDNTKVSALIDTGNSLIRGPSDVVNNILTQVSPAFAANPSAPPTLPCDDGHTLAFQIGGKMFPVDARDFVAQNKDGDATTCIANNVVSTDAPSSGALFSWNFGDPFMKSVLTVFYYGNLTHPSVDPPRIGFVSLVPENADALLDKAVDDAQKSGGNFESTLEAAPTDSSIILDTETTSSTATRTQSPAASAATSPPAAPPTTQRSPTTAAPPAQTSKSVNTASTSSHRSSGAVWTPLLFVTLSLLSLF